MSNLSYDFYNYCDSRGLNGCIDCKYNKNYTEDLLGCAMLFAYEKAIDDVFNALLENTKPTERYIDSETIVRVLEQLKE